MSSLNYVTVAPVLHAMRASIVATCLLLGACAESPVASDSNQPAQQLSNQAQSFGAVGSVSDGVFSSEQSRRGEAQYLDVCERCHEKDLAGGGDLDEFVPPIVGDEFLSEWAQWSVGDLFEFMTLEMPPKRSERAEVTADMYADILAYILEQNGFPSGQAELPPDMNPLINIDMSVSK